ncbi:MAG: DUF3108 domain-containing protein [Acetobacteraceae bacterium]|nr:DUF3108 domain-containing protein [Acetobacteraceae bacterium]
MRLRRRIAPLPLCLVLAPAPAGAEPLLAWYEVRAGRLTIMQVEALLQLDGPRYRIVTRLHTTGLTGFFLHGEQLALAEGAWRGAEPVPFTYRLEGRWRGNLRRVVMDYTRPGQPRLQAVEPPNEAERETVPEELQRGTTDALSAMAKLARSVALTGRCDGEAAVFDGRRRADYRASTSGVERLPAEGAFHGEALRCAFEGRIIAGVRRGDDPEEARQPQFGTAWLARVLPGAPPLPVRIEVPSRWFGTIRVVLTGLRPG